MPSVSEAQRRTMRSAAHNRKFAKKVGIPQKVAREYARADEKAGLEPLPERAPKRNYSY